MRFSTGSLLLGVVSLAGQSLAEVDCSKNITVFTPSDAAAVRDRCRTIEGYLEIARNWTGGDVDLDGVETIKGGILVRSCRSKEDCDALDKDSDVKLFDLSSSTLKELHHDLRLNYLNGLSRVLLPNLRSINGSLWLAGMRHLTEMDLTKLEYLSEFYIQAASLNTLRLNGLKGFLPPKDPDAPRFSINLVGDLLDSVDGFFKSAINPLAGTNRTEFEGEPSVYINPRPSLKNVTLGWTRVPQVFLGPESPAITFGGPETESMRIGVLIIEDTGEIKRGPALRNLTVDEIHIRSDVQELSLVGIDQVSVITTQLAELRSLTLPPQAVDWRNVTIDIDAPNAPLNMTSQYDDAGEQTWYWPKDIHTLRLDGTVSNEFFETFFEQNTTVSHSFHVTDVSSSLDCELLESYYLESAPEGSLAEFSCHSSRSSSASSWVLDRPLQAGLMIAAILYIVV